MTIGNFDSKQCRKNGNLAKALVWLGKNTDGSPKFRWRSVTLKSGPNEHGQFSVECIKDGWLATTTAVRNLTDKELAEALNFEVA
jgi:hypothetical protein